MGGDSPGTLPKVYRYLITYFLQFPFQVAIGVSIMLILHFREPNLTQAGIKRWGL
jgi:hypothetical protein